MTGAFVSSLFGEVLGAYNPKQRELCTSSRRCSSGRGFAQYNASVAKALLRVPREIRDGSVEIVYPFLDHDRCRRLDDTEVMIFDFIHKFWLL